MSEDVKRGEDGNWEPAETDTKKGVATGVVVGVALVVGCFGMICVIGILAAIAIPNFLAMQLRAKRAEAPTNVDGIRTAEKAYHAEWDVFTSVQSCPPDWMSIGREEVAWDAGWDCYSQFDYLGWMPWGSTRCRYTVVAHNAVDGGTDDFTVTSECDIDGDGELSIYRANRAEKATMQSYNNVY